MPRVLFTQNYPQIDLKVQVNSTRIIANSIINREIDIAVVGGEIYDLTLIEDFVYDELSLIISKSHPLLKKKN
jgi:DNA-binding transcriptional LysR family regulator